jgi:hypothetical protein
MMRWKKWEASNHLFPNAVEYQEEMERGDATHLLFPFLPVTPSVAMPNFHSSACHNRFFYLPAFCAAGGGLRGKSSLRIAALYANSAFTATACFGSFSGVREIEKSNCRYQFRAVRKFIRF